MDGEEDGIRTFIMYDLCWQEWCLLQDCEGLWLSNLSLNINLIGSAFRWDVIKTKQYLPYYGDRYNKSCLNPNLRS